MKLYLKILLMVFFYIASSGWLWQPNAAKKDKEARALYDKGKIDEALSKWRDAQIENPDRRELHYNIGNALHQKERYADAFNEYEKALDTENTDLKAKAYYNMGNTHYRMGKLEEAINSYEKALEINPDDQDAKYNIEFIKKKMKEDSEKQKEEGQGDKGESSQEQEEKVKENKKEESSAQGKKDEEKGGDEKEMPGKLDEAQKEKEEGMSKEDALRLLDALKDDEKALQKELKTKAGFGEYNVEKDW